MGTWQGEKCSNIPLSKVPLPPATDLGVVFGPGTLAGDINHDGWVPLPPGVLGVTFTFFFCSPCSPVTPTDIDNNGKFDVAFREIYYSSLFSWADDGVSNIDVETVALHEAGHGLSQAHFGEVFLDRRGNLKFATRAAMNAIYVSPQRNLLGTDSGGHCSLWAHWPKN